MGLYHYATFKKCCSNPTFKTPQFLAKQRLHIKPPAVYRLAKGLVM